MKLTITLYSYTMSPVGGSVTYANHDVINSYCELEQPHVMNCGRVVAYAKDALINLQKHIDAFVDDLKKRVYTDVEITEVVIVDKLQRRLPQKPF